MKQQCSHALPLPSSLAEVKLAGTVDTARGHIVPALCYQRIGGWLRSFSEVGHWFLIRKKCIWWSLFLLVKGILLFIISGFRRRQPQTSGATVAKLRPKFFTDTGHCSLLKQIVLHSQSVIWTVIIVKWWKDLILLTAYFYLIALI